MPEANRAMREFRAIEDFARRENPYNRLHPVIKLVIMIFYTVVVTSFGKYDVVRIFPLFLYPFAIFLVTGLPAGFFLKRILAVQPFVVMIGIFYPLMETEIISVSGVSLSYGWAAFLCLMLKSALIVSAALLLVASSGMDNLAAALRALYLPKIFVLQLLLTYRYIAVLLHEVSRLRLAYSLRAPGQKGISVKAWGPLTGQLLLRSFDKAGRVYDAMRLRGFYGEYITGRCRGIAAADVLWLSTCSAFFLFIRLYNVPLLLEGLVYTFF